MNKDLSCRRSLTLKVAILGVEEVSQILSQVIINPYNAWLKQRMGEPLDVVAHIIRGGLYRLILAVSATPQF